MHLRTPPGGGGSVAGSARRARPHVGVESPAQATQGGPRPPPRRRSGTAAAAASRAGSAARQRRCAGAWRQVMLAAGAAVVAAAARAHLHEHQRAVGLVQDEVDLAAARPGAAGDPMMPPHQHEPLPEQVAQGGRLGAVPDRFRRACALRSLVHPRPHSRAGGPGGRRRPAVSRRRAVCGGHAHRQPRRPERCAPSTCSRSRDARGLRSTRTSGALLASLGLARPTLALHAAQRGAGRRQPVLSTLAAGRARGAASATPARRACRDPGARVVAAARAAGHRGGARARCQQRAGRAERGRRRASAQGFQSSRLPARHAAPSGATRCTGRCAGDAGHAGALRGAAPRRTSSALALAAAAPARTLTLCTRARPSSSRPCATLARSSCRRWLDARTPNRLRGEFVLVLHALPPAPAWRAEDAVRRPGAAHAAGAAAPSCR
jgi:16S rRNA (cytidine1402-2'-O)-methyltransferase